MDTLRTNKEYDEALYEVDEALLTFEYELRRLEQCLKDIAKTTEGHHEKS